MDVKVRRRKADIEDFSWFDIDKYDGASTIGLVGWALVLTVRWSILNLLGEKREEDRKAIQQAITAIAVEPIDNALALGPYLMLPAIKSSVSDLTVFSCFHLRSELEAEGLEDVFGMCGKWNPDLSDEGLSDEEWEVLWSSFDDLLSKRGATLFGRSNVSVNLECSDQQLMNDFSEWLREKRAKFNTRTPKKSFEKSDAADWARYKVLAYIDLQIFSNWRGVRLTHAQLGDMLFPQADIDRPERVRKVVRPLAEYLLQKDVINALGYQAEKAERE